MKKETIKVDGMSCSHCEAAVKRAVSALKGIEDVAISPENGTVSVEFSPDKTSLSEIKEAIEAQGYDIV